MKVTAQELAQLQKIERLFGEIDSIYSGLSDDTRFGLHHLHDFESSFEYCIKQGFEDAKDAVGECGKDSKSILDEFKEYCSQKAQEAGNRYNKQYLDKCMVIDKMWDSDRDDCDMYDRTAEYLIDEYPEWFEDCETIEECERVMKEEMEKDEELFLTDYLGDERMNLSFGAADLKGAVIIEVGSIGRWNGTSNGLNILDTQNIGELLTSNCDQWMCYVDKATGEFCKSEYHHDGSNHYEYRELTCNVDEFEEMLEQAKPGEMAELVSKYSKSIGPRIAEVYGWDLEGAAAIEEQLSGLMKEGFSYQQVGEVRRLVVLEGMSVDDAKLSVKKENSLDKRMKNAEKKAGQKESSAKIKEGSRENRD